jgi:hypothetical protein
VAAHSDAETDVDEMDIESVDGHDELRQAVQLRFNLPPVVVGALISNQFL